MRNLAAGVRSSFLCLVAAASLGACGGMERSEKQPHEATHAVPMKDGVPIGDCVELDPAAQQSQGCPGSWPAAESPCEEPGKACSYIRIEAGDSKLVTYTCQGDPPNWGEGSWTLCAVTCGRTVTNTIDFDSSSCATRTPDECDLFPGVMPRPNGDTLTSNMLSMILADCNAIGELGNTVELAFNDGCPTHLSSADPIPPNELACVKRRLGSVRWSCAARLPCISDDSGAL
jgi:hypothetical protein